MQMNLVEHHHNISAAYALENRVALELVSLEQLRPHEMIIKAHSYELAENIAMTNSFTTPIVVCSRNFIILDGHHRYTAMKDLLNASYISAYLIDYSDKDLSEVSCWREGDTVTKKDVVKAGLSANLMIPKRSKHSFHFDQYRMNIPLELLTKKRKGDTSE